MKIRSVEITAFGKFKNKTIAFTDGLNIISGNNESGKSTVISFIYAMIYGFGDNRGKGLSLREKYTPWDGGTCEGKLSLTLSGGENVTIYRKAGEIKKFDILKVYNTDTAEKINISPEDLIGVSGETYLKTVCIRQLSTVFEGSNSEIVTKLANIAKSGDENSDYEKAIKILETARREIKPLRGSGGELSRTNEEISSIERQKAILDQATSRLETLKAILPSARMELEKAEEEYESALKENFDTSEKNIRERISEKEEYISKSSKKHSLSRILLFTSAVLSALGIVLLLTQTVLWYVPFIISVLTLILGLAKKEQNASSQEEKKLESLKLTLSEIEIKRKAHENKVVSLKQTVLSSREKLSSVNMQISSLEAQVNSADTSSLPLLYEKRAFLEKSLSVLSLVSDSLESSHKKMQMDFTPHINKKAAEYFSFLTDGKYNRLFCDDQFNLCVDADTPKEASFFSGGTVDQIYLALRLALTDMLFKNETIFTILDQPFIQYDSVRTKKALELLRTISQTRQILLFSSPDGEFSGNKSTEILT